MLFTLIGSLRGYWLHCCGHGGRRVCGFRATIFDRKTVSDLMYLSMTSCSSVMVFGGFHASLEEYGLGLTPFTAAKIMTSSIMFGVLALSWTNLRQKSQRGFLLAWV